MIAAPIASANVRGARFQISSITSCPRRVGDEVAAEDLPIVFDVLDVHGLVEPPLLADPLELARVGLPSRQAHAPGRRPG